MKYIVIGDTHGRKIWEEIISQEYFDKVIFVGDYFDSKESISGEDQILNFIKILDFKRKNMEKVVLLVGNHDFHYLENIYESYGGYQVDHTEEIMTLLESSLRDSLLQMCFGIDNYLVSHAGVTNTWLAKQGFDGSQQLEVFINELFLNKPSVFGYQYRLKGNVYGDNIFQSPIWVRPPSLISDAVPDKIQIVGHTMQKTINFDYPNLILVDVLWRKKEYLVIDNQDVKVREFY